MKGRIEWESVPESFSSFLKFREEAFYGISFAKGFISVFKP